MQTWRVEAHGGPESLRRVQVARPEPGPVQALIRVECVGLNHLDIWVRKGVPGHKFPLPLIPGCDIVGTVESVGAGADAALVGTSVIVNPGLSCGRCQACLGGFDPLCRQYGILGETCDGGCADYVVVPVTNLIARPPQLSVEEAAALPIPYLTAWTMLGERKARLQPGELCLIHAGGSGVSVAAIQMAKMIGATVVTTVGSADKAQRALALGADHAILYKERPFREELRKILGQYGKKGCDVIVDHVGVDTFGESLKALAWGGRLVTCGATSGSDISVDLKMIFFKNLSILGSTMGSKSDLIRVVDLVARGKLKALVDSTFDMNDLPKAHARLESRAAFGKVVVRN